MLQLLCRQDSQCVFEMKPKPVPGRSDSNQGRRPRGELRICCGTRSQHPPALQSDRNRIRAAPRIVRLPCVRSLQIMPESSASLQSQFQNAAILKSSKLQKLQQNCKGEMIAAGGSHGRPCSRAASQSCWLCRGSIFQVSVCLAASPELRRQLEFLNILSIPLNL